MGAETVNVYDAKTRLSRLLAQVEGGAEIVISRHGRPVARLVPYRQDRAARRPGLWKDKVTIAAEFDRFSDSDDRDWYGA
ncbi:type II toxin-antitoxin system prevent-host-death family antitoxin [Mycolicibacter longobardus]|uniref:type II toxin-antitoxin system Phd/YefM family antitoxin n=1 Tax=Mycolicibacter longobardus TaxID=1108812 RepID=UPI0021F2FC10|nr:type II toxin-antitoxin system prevent-host-death family antitoxin [Mycolicibacter longobardus]MCV7386047.1 type II toxin-antitoxin system prevent-host-death family antitoxin [Mycolicibacter longobardus]